MKATATVSRKLALRAQGGSKSGWQEGEQACRKQDPWEMWLLLPHERAVFLSWDTTGELLGFMRAQFLCLLTSSTSQVSGDFIIHVGCGGIHL